MKILSLNAFQAVHIQIIDFTPEIHHRWTDKETPEELAEDAKAIKEEQEMNDRLKQTPPHRRISGMCNDLYSTISSFKYTNLCIGYE